LAQAGLSGRTTILQEAKEKMLRWFDLHPPPMRWQARNKTQTLVDPEIPDKFRSISFRRITLRVHPLKAFGHL
jgi:hypothetical protein